MCKTEGFSDLRVCVLIWRFTVCDDSMFTIVQMFYSLSEFINEGATSLSPPCNLQGFNLVFYGYYLGGQWNNMDSL